MKNTIDYEINKLKGIWIAKHPECTHVKDCFNPINEKYTYVCPECEKLNPTFEGCVLMAYHYSGFFLKYNEPFEVKCNYPEVYESLFCKGRIKKMGSI